MGLGILEDRVMDHVPGTIRYFDDPDRPQYASDGVEGLKCDTSGPVPIILVPQPSDDPNDPLNWPLWKKDLITFILSLTAIFATALGPILAANTMTLSWHFTKSLKNVAKLTGWFLLGVGVAGFLIVPSGRIWGKRHLFIGGTVLLVATCAWGGSVGTNYESFIWARILQGVATAPFEAFVNAAVGDLYFVHQRGKRMAFTNLAVFGGAFFTPILVGKITKELKWWWTFYLVAIFCAVCLPAIIFLCPETAYVRDASLNLDLLSTDNPAARKRDEAARDDPEKTADTSAPSPPSSATGTDGVGGTVTEPRVHPVKPKMSYWQSLALFNGRKTNESFWKLLLRPLPLFFQPAFLWACLIQGLLIGWTVFIGVIMAQFFMGPPLWWDEVNSGYAYTGAFVGAIIGFIIAGLLSDWSARYLTKLNGGIYEPEFRIVLVIPQMILGCAGLFGWGVTVDGLLKGEYSFYVPLTFFALEVAGMVIGAVAGSLYIVDAYRDLAIEGFTCMIIFKNMFSFGLTFKAYDWLIENQTKATPLFNALGAVQVVVCVLSIPMYIYGKRCRSFFHRHDLLAMCGVR
ncbi:major facilitator superfamily domain-containing protein [Podospora appendiculata]|uniref:Major facilitator superfamily domain-containing protein n=1 Tax=Podospora appendiculata TaxID=314037 RepID=A0AAE1CBN1_9PEZI|nr:major facilitator superfamily domain-containing protein [Podospora appendiculata]